MCVWKVAGAYEALVSLSPRYIVVAYGLEASLGFRIHLAGLSPPVREPQPEGGMLVGPSAAAKKIGHDGSDSDADHAASRRVAVVMLEGVDDAVGLLPVW